MDCPKCNNTMRYIETDWGDELHVKDVYTCDTSNKDCDIVYVHILTGVKDKKG